MTGTVSGNVIQGIQPVSYGDYVFKYIINTISTIDINLPRQFWTSYVQISWEIDGALGRSFVGDEHDYHNVEEVEEVPRHVSLVTHSLLLTSFLHVQCIQFYAVVIFSLGGSANVEYRAVVSPFLPLFRNLSSVKETTAQTQVGRRNNKSELI